MEPCDLEEATTRASCGSARSGWPPKVRPEYPSDWPAICAVAQRLGIGSAKTLPKWYRQAEVDSGTRPGAHRGGTCEVGAKAVRRIPGQDLPRFLAARIIWVTR
jgi:transposase-like protein